MVFLFPLTLYRPLFALKLVVSRSITPRLAPFERRCGSRSTLIESMPSTSSRVVGFVILPLASRHVSRRSRSASTICVSDRFHDGCPSIQRVSTRVSRFIQSSVVVCRNEIISIDMLPHCWFLGVIVGCRESFHF